MKSRSHHQRNTPATTLNSWPVDLSVRSSLTEVYPNMSASQKWDLLKGTLKSAAETTIGHSVPRHKNPHCQDMADMSETQRKLRLQINNTRNPARKQELKQQRNRILHAQRRRPRDNNNNNKYITSIALKSSGIRARKRNKTKSLIIIKNRGHIRGHHQYEGPPTI